jgi:hypothetical protein
MISVIAFVGDGGGGSEAVDEFVRMGDIVFLAGTADQPDRIAQGVSRGMDFGAQPPRERPRPWACGPLFRGAPQPLADAPARWLSRSSAIRDRLLAPAPRTWLPKRPSRSSGNSAA